MLTDIDDWSEFEDQQEDKKNNYGRNEKATPDDVFNRVGHDVMDAIASNVPLNCYICDYKATTKDAYNEQLL